jgi:hypothetical protein
MTANWRHSLEGALIGVLCGLLPLYGIAGEDQGQSGDPDVSTPKPPAFVYIPPNRGAPKARVGGGTRGIDPLQALAPRHVGLTTSNQPRLYWYLTPGFRNPLRFRLGVADGAAPLLDIPLAPQINGGIQHLDLGQYGFSLTPGPVYQWWVLLEPLPHQGREKIASSGTIQLVAPDPQLNWVAARWRPYLAARRGLWYDALDEVSRLAEGEGNTDYWRRQRSELLDQGGLREAALYDRNKAAMEH